MKLIVTTPLATLVSVDDVQAVRAEDASGAFGVLPGHESFLTALSVCALSWRDQGLRDHYVAVRGGMLSVRQGQIVTVVTPQAVTGDDLPRLEAEVLGEFRRHIDEERAARTDAQRLQLAAIRQIIHLLRPELDRGSRSGVKATGSTSPER